MEHLVYTVQRLLGFFAMIVWSQLMQEPFKMYAWFCISLKTLSRLLHCQDSAGMSVSENFNKAEGVLAWTLWVLLLLLFFKCLSTNSVSVPQMMKNQVFLVPLFAMQCLVSALTARKSTNVDPLIEILHCRPDIPADTAWEALAYDSHVCACSCACSMVHGFSSSTCRCDQWHRNMQSFRVPCVISLSDHRQI